MQDQLLNLWRNIEGHLRVVIFVVFGVLLVAVFAVSAMESGQVPPVDTPPPPPASTDIAVEDPAAKKIEVELYGQKSPIESAQYASLITNSMFDVKAIQNAVAQDQQANKGFEEALRFSQERKYREALDACNRVLAIRSNHFPSLQLKASLETKLRESGLLRDSSPASSGAPAVSGTPSAPATPGAIVPTPAMP